MKIPWLLVLCAIWAQAQTYYATTVAGANHAANGVPATSSPFSGPAGLAFDGAGNLYVADQAASRVRKITPVGLASTLAGTGNVSALEPFTGLASTTQVPYPSSVAADPSGSVYIAEAYQGKVVRVTPSGNLDIYAGLAPCSNCQFGPDGGPATQQILVPRVVATDTFGNLFISEDTFTIRKVDSNGNMTRIAGTGAAGFSGDSGPAKQATLGQVTALATDPNGVLYIADAQNGRIRIISTAGIITTIAGTGLYDIDQVADGTPALSANIYPVGLAYFGGSLYVVDGTNGSSILRLDLGTQTFTNIPFTAGPNFAHVTSISVNGSGGPSGIAVDSAGSLYVIVSGLRRVRKIQGNQIITYAGVEDLGDGKPALNAFLEQPWGVALAGSSVWIADSGNGYVRRVGNDLMIIGLDGTFAPRSVATDAQNDLFVNNASDWVEKYTGGTGKPAVIAGSFNYGFSGDGGPATAALLQADFLTADAAGDVYIAGGNRIRKISAASGMINTIAGNGRSGFSGDGGPAFSAEVIPSDIAVDNQLNVYFPDESSRIRRIATDGTIATIAGTGDYGFSGDGELASSARLDWPHGVAADAAGNVYVSDTYNARVRKITPDGRITTIAGTGHAAPWTSDGPALETNLWPMSLAADAYGNVYVSDLYNSRVIRLSPVVDGSTLVISGGNGQEGSPGTQLPMPLSVEVGDGRGKPIAGVPVTFAGATSFDPALAFTGTDGVASTVVTLGSLVGSSTVTATAPGLAPATFTLEARVPLEPSLSSGGVVGAGLSFPSLHAVSPGGIVSLFGDQFTDPGVSREVGPGDLVNGAIPQQMAGVCVEVNQQRSPVLYVSRQQINFQIPAIAGQGSANVQVVANCEQPDEVRSGVQSVAAQPATPEFFYLRHNADGHNPVAAIDAVTGQLIGPPGQIPGLNVVAAKPGEILSIFATGFGATNPPVVPGTLPGAPAQVAAPVTVTVGGETLSASDILYTGVSGDAGLYQVNIRIPAGLVSGNLPLVINIGQYSSPPGAFLAITATNSGG